MVISTTHKLITIPPDPLLDTARDDNKRELLINLHSIGNHSEIVWVGVSSESKVRVVRSGRVFSLELHPSMLEAGDIVSLESEEKQVSMVFISASPLLHEV